jgi:hypothetical protein
MFNGYILKRAIHHIRIGNINILCLAIVYEQIIDDMVAVRKILNGIVG